MRSSNIFLMISISLCKVYNCNEKKIFYNRQDLIAKVVKKNPRYKNVFDIIQHVEEMANIRKLGERLKISDSDDDDETHRSIEVIL